MPELPDYEAEIEVTGGHVPAFGYCQVVAGSTAEALEVVKRNIESRSGIAWFGADDRPIRWADFFRYDMNVQVTDITAYGAKWALRKWARQLPDPLDAGD